jgi:hypothetical protein
MNTNFKKQITVFGAYLLFLTTWGLAQALDLCIGENNLFFQLIFFVLVYIAFSGVFIPLHLIKKFHLTQATNTSKTRLFIGFVVFLLVSIIGTVFSDAIPLLQANMPTIEGLIKYILLFLPMSLGICLQCFFLIPNTLQKTLPEKKWKPFLIIFLSALSIGIGFWVDQLFISPELAIIQFVLGLFVAIGAYLTQSFLLTYGFYSIILLINTLSEAKYYHYPWTVLIIGFVCVVTIAAVFQYRKTKHITD